MIRLIIIVISFLPIYLIAQTKQLDKANNYYELQQYQLALDSYLNIEQKATLSNSDNGLLQLNIASCYYHLHNPIDAEFYYSNAFSSDVIFSTDQKVEYTNTLIETNKHKEAKEVLLSINEGTYIEQILLDKIKFTLSNNTIDNQIKINSLETKSGYSGYGITIYNSELIFIHYVSSSKSKNAINKYKFTNINGIQINLLDYTDLPTNFNSLSYDSKNNTFYFSGNISKNGDNKIGVGGVNNLAIWSYSLIEENLSPNLLPYSDVDYSNTHPFVTEDGNTIYFASNILGGYGDYDLYKIEKTDDGWSRPENLGNKINTFLNEGYPFYKDGILYFSSDGHPGYGGLDIFKFNFSTNKLENLKKPINSSFDDFSYMQTSSEKAYLSSNRESKNGIDIFYVIENK